MITGKIILKSATKLSLDQRFSEIAKLPPPPTPRIQQQANVIIPYSRQDLFPNKRSVASRIAQQLKKRSINYRRGGGNQGFVPQNKPRVFQRLSFSNRRRGGGNNAGGANSYLFGGQSGMGIRLRGQGRVGGTRTFRPRTRGYLNNNQISRFTRGNRNRNNNINNNNNNRGRRGNNNNNFNRQNRGGRGRRNFNRGRGRNNNNNNNVNNKNVSKETLDSDLDKYMAQTKLENDAIEMNAV